MYKLPKIVDEDEDEVEIGVNMSHGELNAASVLQIDTSVNEISLTIPGDFKDKLTLMYVSLSDGKM